MQNKCSEVTPGGASQWKDAREVGRALRKLGIEPLLSQHDRPAQRGRPARPGAKTVLTKLHSELAAAYKALGLDTQDLVAWEGEVSLVTMNQIALSYGLELQECRKILSSGRTFAEYMHGQGPAAPKASAPKAPASPPPAAPVAPPEDEAELLAAATGFARAFCQDFLRHATDELKAATLARARATTTNRK